MALVSRRIFFYKRLLDYGLYGRHTARSLLYKIISSRPFGSSEGLSTTTLMFQSGANIQELPLVMKKITGQNASTLLFSDNSGNDSCDEMSSSGCDNSKNLPEENELREIINGFNKCSSSNEILKLLEVVPSQYVDSSVAFTILKRIVEIENTNVSENGNTCVNDVSNNFTKTAIFNHLINIILSANEPNILLDCLTLTNRNSLFKKCLAPYFEKVKDSILLSTTEKRYNINDICDIIKEFHTAGIITEIDKLWVGITEEFANIDRNNVIQVYRTLPYFNTSREVIANTLRRKMFSVWWNTSAQDVAEILSITIATKTSSYKLLEILARWLNTKIHIVSEDELLSIICSFKSLEYVNSQITKALERYLKIKGMQIQNASLLAVIMDYCSSFKIRSIPILDKCCDYFIENGRTIPAPLLRSLIFPFGYLNYSPKRSYEYWKLLEEVLRDQFTYLHPEHAMDMILSCIYLERFPINFVNDVFNPFFLIRLQDESDNWNRAVTKLKVFDQSMTLECPSFCGPLLYRSIENSSIPVDEGIRFLVKNIEESLISVAGSDNKISFFELPRTEEIRRCVHIIDVLIPNYRGKSRDVALLFHPLKHYVRDENSLIGPEILRTRLLKKLGYCVVNLNVIELIKLRSNPRLLVKHIEDCIEEVL